MFSLTFLDVGVFVQSWFANELSACLTKGWGVVVPATKLNMFEVPRLKCTKGGVLPAESEMALESKRLLLEIDAWYTFVGSVSHWVYPWNSMKGRKRRPDRLPTIIFIGRAVKLRGCTNWAINGHIFASFCVLSKMYTPNFRRHARLICTTCRFAGDVWHQCSHASLYKITLTTRKIRKILSTVTMSVCDR